MKNPWEEISLEDYENHMRLDSVLQLQALNEMMKGQLEDYPASKVMILGVAGGNGLEHIRRDRVEKVYGVDVNAAYLEAAAARHPNLAGVLECLRVDLREEPCRLPAAELVIANLLVEYIGCSCFQRLIGQVGPEYASCVLQINAEDGWVSDSPYLHAFDVLEAVHHDLDGKVLEKTMLAIGYRVIQRTERGLPNGKKFLRMDFQRP
ncbi:MAG: methyltransferase type 11 [Oscillibacter sp.]|nr:methyltransferase type 11 [Oscillibacter sp.]MCI9299564.1 methyltransferase type 11 [Oscillibacter sp.]